MMAFKHLAQSCKSCFSAFCIISLALLLILLQADLGLTLTGTIPLLVHLNMNLPWFLESLSLITRFPIITVIAGPLIHNCFKYICVHFTFCWFAINSVDFSLEQSISRLFLDKLSFTIYIRVNNPMLNRNTGKYNLNNIWDRVHLNTPVLKMGSSQNPMQLNNNGHIPTNGHPQINIGHSGHALNSEHVLREP